MPNGNTQPFVPIYRQLYEQYKSDILGLRLRPGDRIRSIAELQRRHGVARETAKRVLHMLAEEGYIVQHPGKGSFVADLGPRQQVWGLVFPFYSIQFEDLIHHVAHQAQQAGRAIRHFCDYNSFEEELRLVATMLRERYEAVVVIPTLDESRTWDFYSRLSPLDPPVVIFDHTMTSHDMNFIVQSYDLGVVRAINYLLGKGRGGVAFVENEIWAGRNMVLELMRETYLEILRRRCPEQDPLILPRAHAVNARDLQERGITGIFCCDDISAIQVIGHLREQGAHVPEDFGVASYGNTDIGRFFTPAITTVDPHHAEMAQVLAQLLTAERPRDLAAQRQYVVQPDLIVRGT